MAVSDRAETFDERAAVAQRVRALYERGHPLTFVAWSFARRREEIVLLIIEAGGEIRPRGRERWLHDRQS